MSFAKFFQRFKKPEPEPFQFFEKCPVSLAEQLLPYLPYTDAQNLGDTCTVLRQFVDKNKDRLQRKTYYLKIKQVDDTIVFTYSQKNRHIREWEPCKVEQSIEEPIKIVDMDSIQNDIIQRIERINLRMEVIYYVGDIISDKLFEIIQQNAERVYIDVQKFDVHSFCKIDNVRFMRSTHLIEEEQIRMLISNNPKIKDIRIRCNITSVPLVANHYKEHKTLTDYKLRITFSSEEYDEPAARSTIESYFHPYKVRFRGNTTQGTEEAQKQTTIVRDANTSVFSRFFGCFKCHQDIRR